MAGLGTVIGNCSPAEAAANLGNALAAISATNGSFGCGAGSGFTSTNCVISKGATVASYAGKGLTSANEFGGVCSFCAFPRANPSAPSLPFLYPNGRSVYNELQVKLAQNIKNPLPVVQALNLQIAYSLSRFENSGAIGAIDQDIVNSALDNNLPNRYFGPSGLDRTHQISFGGFAVIGPRFRCGLGSNRQWLRSIDVATGGDVSSPTGASMKLWLNHSISNGSLASWIVSSLTSLSVPERIKLIRSLVP